MSTQESASKIFGARQSGSTLSEYPGILPELIYDAYELQDAVLRLDEGEIGGWKVGVVPPEHRDNYGKRFIGPVMKRSIHVANRSRPNEFVMNPMWFYAVEAEFCVRLHSDLPPRDTLYTEHDVLSAIGAVHIGLEILASPMPNILTIGPAAAIGDYGLNYGAAIGEVMLEWGSRQAATLQTRIRVNDEKVVTGSADAIAGGIAGTLAFVGNELNGRNRTAKAGDWILTGATCGLHILAASSEVDAEFVGIGGISVRVRDGRIIVSARGERQ